MSLSHTVYGIRGVDEEFKRMKHVYDVCVAANVEVPEEVQKFFDYEDPQEYGLRIQIKDALVEDNTLYGGGCIVDLSKLPNNITHIEYLVS